MGQSVLESLGWLAGGGEMGTRIRAKDWSANALGPPETWSRSLQTAVSLCLNSRFPILLWIGPQLRLIYNDAYIPFLGDGKHPIMLGATGRDAWGEIWETIGPLHTEVAAGRAVSVEHLQMFFARRIPREEVYVTFGYSPLMGDDGQTIEGVFSACTETTEMVIGERRLATLRDLGTRPPERHSAESACQEAAEVLRGNPLDVPFAGIYLLDKDGANARLVAGTRLPDSPAVFPAVHPVGERDSRPGPWPLGKVVRTQQPCKVADLAGTVGVFPAGPWPDPVETAFVLPLAAATQSKPAGFLVVGVSPRRILDSGYRNFLDLVARHVAASIADARAFESERKRAEALAEIDRAKTAFFSNVSHEFRTPLTLMMGPIEQILAKPDSEVGPGNRNLLEIAHRNALRLLRLVNTLLNFSRVEAGRVEASYEPVDLAMLTADLASNFRAACERAGLALQVHCRPLNNEVYVDRAMWEKIVLNLVSNAFKFTLSGHIAVSVDADGDKAVLRVEDSGIGIPQAELPQIFERFHRIAGHQGRTVEGTGIGLALVQELVHLHGGTIRAESEVGRGTAFIVAIPSGRDHLPPDQVRSERLASMAISVDAFLGEALRWLPVAGEGTAADVVHDLGSELPAPLTERHQAHVLVVDDNADMRDHLHHILATRWHVEAVSDGEMALAAIRRSKPDLVIADIMMPRLDGIGLLAELRSDSDLLDMPVILLSARAGEEARIEGLRACADDYLVKPFSARELVARVQSSLSLSRLRKQELESMTRLNELSMRLTSMADLDSLL